MSSFGEPINQPIAWSAQQPQPAYDQPYPQQLPGDLAQATYGAPVGYHRPLGPVGKVRSTWGVLGLSIITFGIYSLYWQFATHEEMKQHSGEGIGGVIGLVLALFTGAVATSFTLPNEVGNLYARRGQARPVTAVTGLWVVLGPFILIGPLVWLIKTNGALNAYWRSLGAS